MPYEIEILEPHPYFKIDQCIGVIGPNSTKSIKITYSPITFGSSTTVLRLNMYSSGFPPKDCVVSARALAGLLEKEELIKAQENVKKKLDTMTLRTNNILSGTTTFGTMNNNTVPETSLQLSLDNRIATKSRSPSPSGHKRSDPIAIMLASTFHGTSTNEVLKNSIACHKAKSRKLVMDNIGASEPIDNILLGSKVIDPVSGVRTIKAKVQCKPRGPGSGNVFDAGAEWMANQFKEKHKKRTSKI